MSRIIIYEVTGMTCASCERLVVSALQKIPHVMEVEVSLKRKQAAVRLPGNHSDPDLTKVNEELKVHGYAVYPKGQRPVNVTCETVRRDPIGKRLLVAFFAVLVVAFVAFVLSPLKKVLPSASTGASIGGLFFLGLIASVSTCAASTGALLVAYTSRTPSKFKTIGVHVGRIAAFTLGGALLGALGGSLPQDSTIWYGVVGLVLGFGFLMVGLNFLDLAPSLASFGIRMPSRFSRLADRVAHSEHPLSAFGVGALTFILPCGFTQTAQALALASGSPQRGLLLMLAFALGTAPALMGITAASSGGLLRKRPWRLAIGAVLAFFAIGQIDGGLTVLGSPITPSSLVARLGSSVGESIPAANAQEQVVKMTVAYGTYQPRNLRIKKGVPVRWEIDGKDVYGCANSIVVPTYRISRVLTPGLNVINFTPKSAGAIPFSCGMGMIRGSFTVVE